MLTGVVTVAVALYLSAVNRHSLRFKLEPRVLESVLTVIRREEAVARASESIVIEGHILGLSGKE
jgi:hypothetical protein